MNEARLARSVVAVLGVLWLAAGCDSASAPGTAPRPVDETVPKALAITPEAEAVVASARDGFVIRPAATPRPGQRTRLNATAHAALPPATSIDTYVWNGRLRASVDGAVDLDLGLHAADPFTLRDRSTGVAAHVSLVGASGAAAQRAQGYIVYPQGHPYGSVVHRVSRVGTEDYFLMNEAPARPLISYDVKLDGVRGLRLVENTLELLDGEGSPRLRMAAPSLVDRDGVRHSARVAVRGCAVDTSTALPWGRAVTAPAADHCTVDVAWSHEGVHYPILLDPAWQSASSMAVARTSPAAATFGAKVLVAGGYDAVAYASAEVFDTNTGTWATTGSMASPRFTHTLALLSTGNILAAGGNNGGGNLTLASAEVYDTAAGTWSPTGSLAQAREAHATTALANGNILVVGGYDGTTGTATAEIYTAGSGTWASAGSMTVERQGHTATLLTNGNVLVAGGQSNAGTNPDLASTDIYSGAWAAGPTLTTARYQHTATRLSDGSVLLAGGLIGKTLIAASDVVSATGSSVAAGGSLATPRIYHTATALPDGRVVVTGGTDDTFVPVYAATEIYSGGAFAADGSLGAAREGGAAVLLDEGRALVVGGANATSSLASAEVWPQPTIAAAVAGTSVTVTWGGTPGNSNDWVDIAPQGAPPGTATRSAYTGGAVNGNTVFTVGSGTYVARVFMKARFWIAAESAPFTVAAPTTTVTLDAASTLSSPVNVIIDYAGMSGSAYDYVALAPAGSPSTTFSRYVYTNGALSGSVSFANVTSGSWVARAYFNNGTVRQAESAPFTVTGAATTLTLDAASTLTSPVNAIIDYANMSGAYYDYVVIATAGSPDTSYLLYKYTLGAVNGSAAFANLATGTYVARAFFSGSSTKQAESAPFTVTGAVPTVTLDASSQLNAPTTIVIDYTNMSGATYDFIGLSLAGSPDAKYLKYQYTYGAISGKATFTGLPSGTYVARAYFNLGSVSKAQSSNIVTTGAPPTVAPTAGTFAVGGPVTINYSNDAGGYFDYVAVALASSPTTVVKSSNYLVGVMSGQVSLSGIPAGTYVAQLFFDGSSSVQATSATFTVQ
jgi:Kelch motif/Galactose oxidase, central domain